MIAKFFASIFGSHNGRILSRYAKIVRSIKDLSDHYEVLRDDELRALTLSFKKRHKDGESLDGMLKEAFAALNEASSRTLSMRYFDVQFMGGMALHEGNIAEMATGEGKTLVATLALYLNALTGNGVHLVTVNNYLAQRDAEWMRPLYEFMGMTVAVVYSGQSTEERSQAYTADIIYGTNSEFGFDYLRDNMVLDVADRVQNNLHFAIVDEVDSILVDEARTPLIISGASDDSSKMYQLIDRLMPEFINSKNGDNGYYVIDEKQRRVDLTETGHLYVEDWLRRRKLLPLDESLYEAQNLNLLNHVNAALRAYTLYQLDVHYVVHDNEILLIDEHTGRTMIGRRLSEGIHQALEAREQLAIQAENQTLASITYQNYFRLYDKLSGMTGTAVTEAGEFYEIYNLTVIIIPTNQLVTRKDLNDLVYLSKTEKLKALVQDIRSCIDKGAPVLVGTVSIDSSEELSIVLRKAGIKHAVLNAKQHEREAEIIAQAGRSGVVTIATNMAGRGTDIVLGGNPKFAKAGEDDASWQKQHAQVLAAGGLHILATERHESRRIDNQLRGRAGRQGDVGTSRFYLSMEDNLMRIFVSDGIKRMMQNLGLGDGDVIENRMVSNAIEKAQKRVEAQNFEVRKQLLEYDDIVDVQRKVVYSQRLELLGNEDISEDIDDIRDEILDMTISTYIPPQSHPEQWNLSGLAECLKVKFSINFFAKDWENDNTWIEEEKLRDWVVNSATTTWNGVRTKVGPALRYLEKYTMLQILDTLWRQHLSAINQLRQGIHLRAYAQRNPKEEYKREAFLMFRQMMDNVKHDLTVTLLRLDAAKAQAIVTRWHGSDESAQPSTVTDNDGAGNNASNHNIPTASKATHKKKIGRNDPCFCGSGIKYKNCHGK